jgi:hypothetical protein
MTASPLRTALELAASGLPALPLRVGKLPRTLLPLPRRTFRPLRAPSGDPWAQGSHSIEPPF